MVSIHHYQKHNGACPHLNPSSRKVWDLYQCVRPYLKLLRGVHCSNGASVLLWQTSLSPREIRQQSCSPVRLRHGIDAKSSRGGLMMFQSYPYALLLFFWLSAFARGTWPVHSCCHLTASPPSSHSRGVGGLPTQGSCSCNVNCCSPLWIYAAFVSFSFIYWLKRQNIT